MQDAFFLVGPTAVGKSTLAVDVAEKCGAEIINADAFQIYRGLDLLTAKTGAEMQQRVPHHLLGAVPLSDTMSAAKFRDMALDALADILSRGKKAIVVGGSGLYVKALTHGFNKAPPPDLKLREELNALSLNDLVNRLNHLNPELAARTDLKNRRRISRAIEISVIPSEVDGSRRANLKGAPRDHSASLRSARDDGVQSSGGEISAAETVAATPAAAATEPAGVFLIRDREDLYERINERVNTMFRDGVEKEVRALTNVGPTAASALGLQEIRQLLAGQISREECIAKIQQATRRYAKRQLTWFRHQTNFPQLNLTSFSHREVVSAISQMFDRARE